jgi:maltooligosyltrehalose trehalohydrolase
VDVVYNHFGPDGNYLRSFAPEYFTDRYQTPWGDAINYDGPKSHAARKLVVDNALYWIHEYHVDGLRFDATHAMHDGSERHILQELTETVRGSVPVSRQVVLIAETSENDVRYLMPVEQGGYGLDVVYADDLHHSLRRYLVGDHEGYYEDFEGTLSEVARIIRQGWLYEGQPSRHHEGQSRGTPARERPAYQFQVALQNHDQVGNRACGERLNHELDLDRYRAASALLLFLPFTPLLFMGQEFAASTPFLFFTDHAPELGKLVTEGRRREFARFAAFSDAARRDSIPDPQAESTFVRSKLRLEEAEVPPGAEVQQVYRDLLHLRATDVVLRSQDRQAMHVDAAGDHALIIRRWHGLEQRLLGLNFGDASAPLPLPPGDWTTLFSTGAAPELARKLVVPPRTAVILTAHGRA